MNTIKKLAGYKLWLGAQNWQREFNSLLRPYGLTHAQYMILSYIVWADQKWKLAKWSQNKLAKKLWLNAMMVSNVLRALEAKWFVTRTTNPKSTASIISSTPAANKLIKEVEPLIKKFEKDVFKSVGPDFKDDINTLSKRS